VDNFPGPTPKQVAEIERLAGVLGGGWRIDQGVMPVVVLTITEAARLEERFAAAGAQSAHDG
jgi:hypothetical protein